MSGDPSADLQKAIVAALLADSAVTALVSTRVWDAVPPTAAFPYITIFDAQTVDDEAECIAGSECFLDIHIWSRSAGAVEAKNILSAVRNALHEKDLTLSAAHRLVEIRFRDSLTVRDPDGITTHIVVHFRALTEAA